MGAIKASGFGYTIGTANPTSGDVEVDQLKKKGVI